MPHGLLVVEVCGDNLDFTHRAVTPVGGPARTPRPQPEDPAGPARLESLGTPGAQAVADAARVRTAVTAIPVGRPTRTPRPQPGDPAGSARLESLGTPGAQAAADAARMRTASPAMPVG